MGSLHEASCVTLERVVVQNILHGLSPSLSDAVASCGDGRYPALDAPATPERLLRCFDAQSGIDW